MTPPSTLRLEDAVEASSTTTAQDPLEVLMVERSRWIALAQHYLPQRQDAEDAVQTAFVKALLHREKYKGNSKLRTWLYAIVKNAARDKRRHLGRLNARMESLGYRDAFQSPETPYDILSCEERFGRLHAALDRLDPKFGRPVQLRYLQGLSYNDIASELRIPIGTVRSRLHYGCERLKELISEK